MSTPFKRAYKACEACRKSKAKCELDASATACSRCQREQKDCSFPVYRSAKRARMSEDAPIKNCVQIISNLGEARTSSAIPVLTATSENLASASATSTSSTTATRKNTRSTQDSLDSGLTVTSLSGSSQQEVDRSKASITHEDPLPPSDLQNDVLHTFVTNSTEAIGLLFRAAEHNDSEGSDENTALDHTQHQDDVPDSVYSMPSPALASNETLNLWSQHRFVRQGWFTEREAISYIEFFFLNLSPLSPVADAYYADHKNHKRLILEEPLLCCTILMIASRHHIPSRNGGGKARADFVHNRTWRHIEHLIQRITFGSEKYSLAKTRTLGSIQALLLIIEWHPRALHFPPENDGWDASLAPTIDDAYQPQNSNSDGSRRWREDVFEPAKRSDRLSWMLVGLATTLGHELGVFDYAENENIDASKQRSVCRIRRLLFLYASQLSLRLGCTSIFPHSMHQNVVIHDPSNGEEANSDRDLLTTKWIDITKLMTTANEMLFSSPATTKQMFKTLRYVNLLEHFQPLLHRWYVDFEAMTWKTISIAAKQILLIEYQFVRMYINSVAVQALVERAKNYNSSNVWLDHEFLSSELSNDFRFVKEVRESSLEILGIATKLSENGVLQFCPVRVFLRIVAASIYLLKTISLGSRETDVARSLSQLQECIETLRKSEADDIHLSSRYAVLIARHVRQFKRNFRVKKPNSNPNSTSRAVSRDPEVRIGSYGELSNKQAVQHSEILQQTRAVLTNAEDANASLSVVKDGANAISVDERDFLEDWLAQPFDLQCAPFGFDGLPPTAGLALDSLDFLWNLTT